MVIASCSKKDSASPSGAIVGKWSIASDTVRLYDNTNTTLVATEANDQIQPSDYVQFNSNGTGNTVEFGMNIGFTYKVNGTVLNIVTKGGTYGGVQIDGDSEDVTIRHIDSHTLYTYQVSADTVNTTIYISKESIHFTK